MHPGLLPGCSPCRASFPHSLVRAASRPSREVTMTRTCRFLTGLVVMLGLAIIGRTASADEPRGSVVLEWNQIFIDTLIATNTPNSSSQRLGAIVHTAIFDAYNGIERRYTPLFVHDPAPAARRAERRSSRRRTRHWSACSHLNRRRSMPATRLRWRRWATRARIAAIRGKAASNGGPGSPRRYSPGARPMDSLRATLRSTVGPRWASGGRHHPRSEP